MKLTYMNLDDEDMKNTIYYANPDDTRIPKLTLKHLNKIKKFRSVRDYEQAIRNQVVSGIYGNSGSDDSDGGF